MKIKISFVTNSSSTAYIVTSLISGRIPYLGKVENLSKTYDEKDIYGFTKAAYVKDEVGMDYETIGYEKAFKSLIIMKNTFDWIAETDTEAEITILNIKIENYSPSIYPQIDIVTQVLEKFLNHFKKKVAPYQLLYTAFPSDFKGDGWDGGDPLGPCHHGWTFQAYKEETKMGILNVINKKIIPEIDCIGDNMSINAKVLEVITKQGVDENDSNS
jgi:hypothetical protein